MHGGNPPHKGNGSSNETACASCACPDFDANPGLYAGRPTVVAGSARRKSSSVIPSSDPAAQRSFPITISRLRENVLGNQANSKGFVLSSLISTAAPGAVTKSISWSPVCQKAICPGVSSPRTAARRQSCSPAVFRRRNRSEVANDAACRVANLHHLFPGLDLGKNYIRDRDCRHGFRCSTEYTGQLSFENSMFVGFIRPQMALKAAGSRVILPAAQPACGAGSKIQLRRRDPRLFVAPHCSARRPSPADQTPRGLSPCGSLESGPDPSDQTRQLLE